MSKSKKQKTKHKDEGQRASSTSDSASEAVTDFDIASFRKKMECAVEHVYHELAAVRTGRASTSLLDSIIVDVYGDKQPLPHVATILARGPRTLVVTVFDSDSTSAVMNAIRTSPLHLIPQQDRSEVIVPVPALSPESRKAMVKLARQVAEQGRAAVRQVRHRAMGDIKSRGKSLPEDDKKRHEKAVEELTKEMVVQVDESVKRKEDELAA